MSGGNFYGFPSATRPAAASSMLPSSGSVSVPLRAAAHKYMPHSLAAITMPHVDNDGKYFAFGSLSYVGVIELRSAAGSVIWSVAATAINSTAVIITTGYIDYSEGRFYVFAHDSQGSTTIPYFAYINLATGAVVNLATLPTGWLGSGFWSMSMSRAAQGSGDLRIYLGSGSGPLLRYTLGANSGSITSTQSLTFGYGSPPVVPLPVTAIFGHYFISADERLIAHIDPRAIHILRGGGYGVIAITALFNAGAVGNAVTLFANGSGISLLSASGYVVGARHFSQDNFLGWLHATADAIGLPN